MTLYKESLEEDDDIPVWSSANKEDEQESFEDYLDDADNETDALVTYQKPKYELFAHQTEAFERYKDSSEIALFLEQGLGKSAISLLIAKYKYQKKEIDALLIIAPNGVHTQWAREQIPLWLQGVEYDLQVIGGRGGKKARRFRSNILQIVCTNIDTFSTPTKWRDITEWSNACDTFIILDEATVIKNITAARTQRLLYEFNNVVKRGKRIMSSTPKSKVRAILTGTPVTNGPFDVWAIFEFLRPNYFKRNYYSFRSHYAIFYTLNISSVDGRGRSVDLLINSQVWHNIKACITWNEANALFGVSESTYNYIQAEEHYNGPFRNIEELKRLMAPISMFKTIEDCVDMPGQIYNRRMIDMSPAQTRAYNDMESYLIAEYEGKVTTAKSKLTAYLRLQQIASGFMVSIPEFELVNDEEEVYDPREKEVTWFDDVGPKMEILLLDVETCTTPCIIICHFSAEAEKLYELVSKIKKCALITGWKRVGTIEEFQQGKYDCIIANVKCISRGFNLQRAHRMFFYSNTFSLEDRLQTESRIYRIGQKEKCEYVDYITTGTIEMKIVAALRQKKDLLDYVRDTSIKDMLTEVDDIFKEEYGGIIF